MQQMLLPGLRSSSNPKFQSVLDYIDEVSSTPTKKGELFERLMQQYFTIDPIYQERFSAVYRWKEWASLRGHSAQDLGIEPCRDRTRERGLLRYPM